METQHTRNICVAFVQCRPNAEDVGPTLYKMLHKCFVFAGLVKAAKTQVAVLHVTGSLAGWWMIPLGGNGICIHSPQLDLVPVHLEIV